MGQCKCKLPFTLSMEHGKALVLCIFYELGGVHILLITLPKTLKCCVCKVQFINSNKGDILKLDKFMLCFVLIYKVTPASMPSWRISHIVSVTKYSKCI